MHDPMHYLYKGEARFRPGEGRGGYQLSIFVNYVTALKPSQTLKSDQSNSSITYMLSKADVS